jgi:four helix bundle protein
VLEGLSRSASFCCTASTPDFARDEKYRLGDQILRAARSATANIAEGYGRYHHMDNAKFVSNARASCWEVLDHLITAQDENLINKELLLEGREKITVALKLLNGYLNYLRKAATKSK